MNILTAVTNFILSKNLHVAFLLPISIERLKPLPRLNVCAYTISNKKLLLLFVVTLVRKCFWSVVLSTLQNYYAAYAVTRVVAK